MSGRNAAARRHHIRNVTAAIFYAASLMLEEYLIRHTALPTIAKFGLAILPALAIIAMIAGLGAYIVEERDEYVRALTIRQMLWGTAIALSALTLWGFPEQEGLLPHMPAYFAAIFWFAGYGIAGIAVRVFDR